jgi:hypothetical protein
MGGSMGTTRRWRPRWTDLIVALRQACDKPRRSGLGSVEPERTRHRSQEPGEVSAWLAWPTFRPFFRNLIEQATVKARITAML